MSSRSPASRSRWSGCSSCFARAPTWSRSTAPEARSTGGASASSIPGGAGSMMNTATIEIAGRSVGQGEPVLVIAEAGVNDNGSVERALELVDAAADAGADAVKFQTFDAKSPGGRERRPLGLPALGDRREGQVAMLEQLELPRDAFAGSLRGRRARAAISLHSRSTRRAPSCSPTRRPAFKVGSGISPTPRSCRSLAGRGARSCSPPEWPPWRRSRRRRRRRLGRRRAARPAALRLQLSRRLPSRRTCGRSTRLRGEFGVPVGYSDHALGLEVALGAVALGAAIIEKHYTLDRGARGPDHALSLEPDELAELVGAIRRVEVALGDGRSAPSPPRRNTAGWCGEASSPPAT